MKMNEDSNVIYNINSSCLNTHINSNEDTNTFDSTYNHEECNTNQLQMPYFYSNSCELNESGKQQLPDCDMMVD
jgi:hypothetical protein